MLTVRIPDDLNQRLEKLSHTTQRSKSYYVKKALKEFLEDREDYLLAVAALEEHKKDGGKCIAWEEVKKQLKLDD